VKPAPFAYHAPTSLPEATALLAAHGEDAKVLAGGQSLVPMLAFRLVTPGHLVDIGRVAGLSGYSLDEGELRIRAGVRQREIERSAEVGFAFPVLHEAIAHVAHTAIRNRGTVCGSLAHADPAAELPAVMVALRATMVAEGPDGRREIPAEEFFLFHLTSALRPDEILTEVRVPRPAGALTFGAFDEVSRRRGDFALVGVAAVVRFDGRRVADCRIVCSGVGATPFLATAAAGAVLGTDLADDVLLDAQRATGSGMHPSDDIHATAGYRRQVAGVLVRRCLTRIRAEQGAVHG
jgi:aerobic carbon-monoxide dehydrogenase medium subunit